VQVTGAALAMFVVVAVVVLLRPVTAHTRELLPAVPTIGPAQVVDRSNVADPFVLTVRNAPGSQHGSTT
jgi:hypothetical protein